MEPSSRPWSLVPLLEEGVETLLDFSLPPIPVPHSGNLGFEVEMNLLRDPQYFPLRRGKTRPFADDENGNGCPGVGVGERTPGGGDETTVRRRWEAVHLPDEVGLGPPHPRLAFSPSFRPLGSLTPRFRARRRPRPSPRPPRSPVAPGPLGHVEDVRVAPQGGADEECGRLLWPTAPPHRVGLRDAHRAHAPVATGPGMRVHDGRIATGRQGDGGVARVEPACVPVRDS